MRKDRMRTTSVSSSATEYMDIDKERETKRRKKGSAEDIVSVEQPSKSILDEVKAEREQMEEYLFDEANKVNRNAITFILENCNKLENKLHEKIIENEKLKAIAEKSPRSYTDAAAATSSQRPTTITSSKGKAQYPCQKEKAKCEVILIKPQNDTDTRTNEQIKQDITKKLNCIRSAVRVNNIRQMRNKGVVVEVKDTTNVELNKKCELEKIGLKIEKPKKINPSIIIYDVEKEYKVEELKEDFIKINFIITGDKRCLNILLKMAEFLFWRSYRIREYINITRCYKCHGYGQIAKTCKTEDQFCITCGSKGHNKDECPCKEKPKCGNCVRARRKYSNHDDKSKKSPEYVRQLELYRNRIQWL
ncbi:Uncharacterized 50 kDa protein in type I retrotransposable element R1DM [Anthophora plagiata]